MPILALTSYKSISYKGYNDINLLDLEDDVSDPQNWEFPLAACTEFWQRENTAEMSDHQLRTMIEREAQALGLSFDDAVTRVQKGEVGENYLWQDLASLVQLPYK